MGIKIFSYNVHGLPFIMESWTRPLCEWFHDTDYDFICLQEVFTEGRVAFLTDGLRSAGYTVVKPNDVSGNLLSSGLLTAVRSTWTVVSDFFQPYTSNIGLETLANKGFHCMRVFKDGCELQIVNTHLQADNAFNFVFSHFDVPFHEIRRRQIKQLLDGMAGRHNCIIIGDINSESEPHSDITYLTGTRAGISKHTFQPTGEDLDHVAFVPSLWKGYTVPVAKEVAVLHKLWWSDHWPIHVRLTYERSSTH